MSLEHCPRWKKEIDDVVQLLNGDPIPIVLIANKVCQNLKVVERLSIFSWMCSLHRLTVVNLTVKN